MVEVRAYKLPPTALIPNSPYPLLHYPGFFSLEECKPGKIYDRYEGNGWQTQWIFRYDRTQKSHYHSRAHECMTVLSGTAKIRFGVADTSENLDESTYGSAYESGGVEIEAKAGDVFILPAGVAHKTHDTTTPKFALLTPGGGKRIDAKDPRKALDEIELEGFTMMGAYPVGSQWDFHCGTQDREEWERTWRVERPRRDPVLGESREGICGRWVERRESSNL